MAKELKEILTEGQKLDSKENYISWCLRMQRILRMKNLWHVVESPVILPEVPDAIVPDLTPDATSQEKADSQARVLQRKTEIKTVKAEIAAIVKRSTSLVATFSLPVSAIYSLSLPILMIRI